VNEIHFARMNRSAPSAVQVVSLIPESVFFVVSRVRRVWPLPERNVALGLPLRPM
jgi:hypothetical protein